MNTGKISIVDLDKKKDPRGYFCELISGKYVNRPPGFGLIYITQAANPGVIKGNHYHRRKTEWFCLIKGRADLFLRPVKGGDARKVELADDRLRMVKIPPGIVHAFRNTGSGEMILLAYISEEFNPDDPDTFQEKII